MYGLRCASTSESKAYPSSSTSWRKAFLSTHGTLWPILSQMVAIPVKGTSLPSSAQPAWILILGILLAEDHSDIHAGQDYKQSFAAYKSHRFAPNEMDAAKLEKLAQLWSSAEDAENDSVDQSTLELANSNFSYLGVPINPLIVKEFQPWFSDEYSSVLSIDIGASQFSNRYYEGSMPRFNKVGYVTSLDSEDGSTFGYKWLGILANGIHVLKVFEDTAGSAVLIGLSFVTFRLDTIAIAQSRTQLVMTNEGVFGV
jgi:hypothetical protein